MTLPFFRMAIIKKINDNECHCATTPASDSDCKESTPDLP